MIKACGCGHCNCPPLPIEGYATIGPRMGALITYLNVEHALPYERLSQITHDLLGFAISEGTIANKLAHMQRKAKGIIETIKDSVMHAAWIGSDETGTKVAGKKSWQWVWQSPLASYFVLDHRREYAVVKTHLQHVITATAINVVRLLAWVAEIPRCTTRISRFAALAP